MPKLNKEVRAIYVYPPVRARLLELKRRMSDEKGGRNVSWDTVIERLLDIAAEREEQGA